MKWLARKTNPFNEKELISKLEKLEKMKICSIVNRIIVNRKTVYYYILRINLILVIYLSEY